MWMAEIVQADVKSLAFGISERMLLEREPIIQTNCSFREQDRGDGSVLWMQGSSDCLMERLKGEPSQVWIIPVQINTKESVTCWI